MRARTINETDAVCVWCDAAAELQRVLEGGDVERPEGVATDAELGAAFRALYEAQKADADDEGVWPGSAADQCAMVYEVFTRHGLVVR